MLLITSLSYSQEKWRELSFTNVTGTTVQGHLFNQTSANLSYELNNNYFITSWNGVNYNFYTKQNWFASQSTIDKKIKQFVIGTGYQYGGQLSQTTELFFIAKVQYKIKL